MSRHWKVVQWASIAIVAALIVAFITGWYLVAIVALLGGLVLAISLIDAFPSEEESGPSASDRRR